MNSGTIVGTAGYGIHILVAGGSVENNGGLIEGYGGVFIYGTAATVTNSGTIRGNDSDGVDLDAGGSLGNTGLIVGYYGVYIGSAAVTVTNSGTITGATGIAIGNRGTGNDTIVNFGTIVGTNGIAVRLGSGDEQIVLDRGSQLQGAVANFHPGDTFDLPFMSFSSSGSAAVVSNGTVSQTLRIVENGATFTIALAPTQSFIGDYFHLGSDGSGGTLV